MDPRRQPLAKDTGSMKDRVRKLLENEQFDDIVERAATKKRVLNILVSLTFDADRVIAWRAVEALGLAADRVAEDNPEFVRGHLRRLHWFMSDESGAVCWYAPQAMAEIVRHRPDMFHDYAEIVFSLIHTTAEEDLAQFRTGILWAIGRLAPVALGLAESVLPAVVNCLAHRDPQVRGLAVWCLRQTRRDDLLAAQDTLVAGRDGLDADDGAVEIYRNRRLEQTSVRALLDS
jgi:hypothetical protein